MQKFPVQDASQVNSNLIIPKVSFLNKSIPSNISSVLWNFQESWLLDLKNSDMYVIFNLY